MAIADSLVGCSVGITRSIERDILLELSLVEIWGMYIYSGIIFTLIQRDAPTARDVCNHIRFHTQTADV
jgi:hypothetical protein